MDGKYRFRVYSNEGKHSFIDYDIRHSDLMVTICDEDSALYTNGDLPVLAHSLDTLIVEMMLS